MVQVRARNSQILRKAVVLKQLCTRKVISNVHRYRSQHLHLETASISKNCGAFGRLPYCGCGPPGLPFGATNIAARAAAANPRRPTPAIPAAPPVFVSMPLSAGGTKASKDGGLLPIAPFARALPIVLGRPFGGMLLSDGGPAIDGKLIEELPLPGGGGILLTEGGP